MNIKEYARIKQELEIRISILSNDVEKRWEALIGSDCGYFHGWDLDGDIVIVEYRSRRGGDNDTDDIPMRFFEIEGDQEAVKEYEVFRKQKADEANLKQISEKRESRWEEYKKLRQEFEPNG
jgi:hypothetical protein